MGEPAYTRLQVDERRRQLLDAGTRLFAEHAFEEISMRRIAEAAGVSKALVYHYFPSKTALFRAAVEDATTELQELVASTGEGTAFEQLERTLDAYLRWIERNGQAWARFIQSTAIRSEGQTVVDDFRTRTTATVLAALTGDGQPRPALRMAVKGWLGYLDAAIFDWVQAGDMPREQVHRLLVTAFGAALAGARDVDPEISLEITRRGPSATGRTRT
ncbi:MAG TPA: TetR/AcrR family transcriptional regulator [Solirubrobacteraceae bacterium]